MPVSSASAAWSRYRLEQVSPGAGIAWSRYRLEQVSPGAGIAWGMYRLEQVSPGAGIAWSRYRHSTVARHEAGPRRGAPIIVLGPGFPHDPAAGCPLPRCLEGEGEVGEVMDRISRSLMIWLPVFLRSLLWICAEGIIGAIELE